ncbi:MAG: hypothetical protein WCC92_05630, partial [Candidatus Korobacteraceae bacterium]
YETALGTGRFGDYVTIRQEFNPDGASRFFEAFGYGLNTGANTTDVRYVVFGRPSCDTGSQLAMKAKPHK